MPPFGVARRRATSYYDRAWKSGQGAEPRNGNDVTTEIVSSQVKQTFERDGFLLLHGYVNTEEADAINDRVNRYITEVLPSLAASESLYEVKGDPDSLMRLNNMHKHDDFFDELINEPRFNGAAAEFLGDEVVPTNVELFDKPPRVGKITPPHQDGFYFMLEPNEAITLWLALEPSDVENGCMRFIPGSRWRGIRPHARSNVLGFSQGITDFGKADEEAEQAVEAQPGDVIAHHSMTIHRTGDNLTDRRRRALGLVYYARSARHDADKAAAYQEQLYRDWEKKGKL